MLRELNAGRLAPAAAVAASGLLDRPGVPELHRAALAAALGGTAPPYRPAPGTAAADALRTEIASVRAALLAEIASVRAALRTEIASVRASGPDAGTAECPRWTGPRWWPSWPTRSAMPSAAESGGHRTTTR